MYESYWGLTQSPFRNSIDERWYYHSPMHDEAVSRLFYLVEQRRQCGLLVGPAGTGKSLLLDLLAKQVARTQRRIAVVDLLGLRGDEILWQLATEFAVVPARQPTLRDLWRDLNDCLKGLHAGRVHTVLIFDHLERASVDCSRTLERLLLSQHREFDLLTAVVATRTAEPETASTFLRDISDLRIDLPPLDRPQTERYVRQLMKTAGCKRRVFSESALAALFEETRGVPRDINRLCDLSLLAGMGEQRAEIDEAVLRSACGELQARRGMPADRYALGQRV